MPHKCRKISINTNKIYVKIFSDLCFWSSKIWTRIKSSFPLVSFSLLMTHFNILSTKKKKKMNPGKLFITKMLPLSSNTDYIKLSTSNRHFLSVSYNRLANKITKHQKIIHVLRTLNIVIKKNYFHKVEFLI